MRPRRQFAGARADGRLKFFNRAYREDRLRRQASGRPAMPYAWAMDRLRQVLLSNGGWRGGPLDLGPSVLAQVFGCADRARVLRIGAKLVGGGAVEAIVITGSPARA